MQREPLRHANELLIGGAGSGTLPHWDAPVSPPVYFYVVEGRKSVAQVEVNPDELPEWLAIHTSVGDTTPFFTEEEWDRFASWCVAMGGTVQEVSAGA